MDIFDLAATATRNNPLLPDWIREVEKYCLKEKITVNELIKAHRKLKKDSKSVFKRQSLKK